MEKYETNFVNKSNRFINITKIQKNPHVCVPEKTRKQTMGEMSYLDYKLKINLMKSKSNYEYSKSIDVNLFATRMLIV